MPEVWGTTAEAVVRHTSWAERVFIGGTGRWRAMLTVLTILGTILALVTVPIATILGWVGFLIFGFWGALIGVIVGLMMETRS